MYPSRNYPTVDGPKHDLSGPTGRLPQALICEGIKSHGAGPGFAKTKGFRVPDNPRCHAGQCSGPLTSVSHAHVFFAGSVISGPGKENSDPRPAPAQSDVVFSPEDSFPLGEDYMKAACIVNNA
jgi:hypothetical protein